MWAPESQRDGAEPDRALRHAGKRQQLVDGQRGDQEGSTSGTELLRRLHDSKLSPTQSIHFNSGDVLAVTIESFISASSVHRCTDNSFVPKCWKN